MIKDGIYKYDKYNVDVMETYIWIKMGMISKEDYNMKTNLA